MILFPQTKRIIHGFPKPCNQLFIFLFTQEDQHFITIQILTLRIELSNTWFKYEPQFILNITTFKQKVFFALDYITNVAKSLLHYSDVIMSTMSSQITSFTIVYSTVYSGADERKHQNTVPLAFVRGTHRSPVYSPNKGPVTRKMFPFDDVIMWTDIPDCHPCSMANEYEPTQSFVIAFFIEYCLFVLGEVQTQLYCRHKVSVS